jgi:hypothetical protein
MSELKEYVFAHAVALMQSGRMRSTIHVKDRRVFIVNFDKTVILRFDLPDREPPFRGEIGFEADDYDSDKFREVDGRIVFTLESGNYVRQKSCATPKATFSDVERMWGKLDAEQNGKKLYPIFLERALLQLIDEGLSHVEIHESNGGPVLIQRDIFTGTVYRIEKATNTRGLMIGGETVPPGLRLGLRTPDFLALFNYNPALTFHVAADSPVVWVTGDRLNMRVALACCRYDEIGDVEVIEGLNEEPPQQEDKDDGRKIPQEQERVKTVGPENPPARRRRERGNPVDGGGTKPPTAEPPAQTFQPRRRGGLF